MASAAARNARLQVLLSATQTWAASQTAAINAQVLVLQNILKGRTGSSALPASVVAATSTLVVTSITSFLTGD